MFLLSFKGKRSGLDRKARKRGGKATQRGLSHEQVPVLVARDRDRDRAGATMGLCAEGNGHGNAVCCTETVLDERCCTLYRRQQGVCRRST
jgi:hypothetical protein